MQVFVIVLVVDRDASSDGTDDVDGCQAKWFSAVLSFPTVDMKSMRREPATLDSMPVLLVDSMHVDIAEAAESRSFIT